MIEPKLYMNGHWMVPLEQTFVMWIRNPTWPPLKDLVFSQWIRHPLTSLSQITIQYKAILK